MKAGKKQDQECTQLLTVRVSSCSSRPHLYSVLTSFVSNNYLYFLYSSEYLEKLKFGIGDGNLQYYLYNWKCPEMKPEEIGLVLQ